MQANASRARPARWVRTLTTAAAGAALLALPGVWALRSRLPTALDGIETLDDAAAECRRTGLAGWELVTYAQRLVYRKFTHYSCRNLLDTPGRAFRRGMGYCTQYNLALKQLLDRLDVDTTAVFSARVRIFDAPEWNMGHTWLRVRVGGEERDVCAGHAGNLPGQVNFTPLAPVWPGSNFIFILSHLGVIGLCGFLEWRALVTRQPLPAWMFVERQHPVDDPGSQ